MVKGSRWSRIESKSTIVPSLHTNQAKIVYFSKGKISLLPKHLSDLGIDCL